MNKSNVIAAVLLVVAILGSGLGLVYTKHVSRELFIEWQSLRVQEQELDIEWEMLQLEQSTLAAEVVVDHAARVRLGMEVPDPGAVVYVTR